MLTVGFVGWRGMVGSVLMQRMIDDNDFSNFNEIYFTTSQVGQAAPRGGELLKDAYNIEELKKCDVIVTCQGGDYTKEVYPKIRSAGWKGYWIDAASALRMENDSIIVLDPVNMDVIKKGLQSDIKTYVGGNCTVSLMLMGIVGLFKANLVEWISSMTYQSASGAGAKNMIELIAQMCGIADSVKNKIDNPSVSALELDKIVSNKILSSDFPVKNFRGVPLAASLIPWIDTLVENGQSREEWKGIAETNKILGINPPIPVDGLCVRVGAMRCHSQGLTIKLKKNVPLNEIEDIIKNAHQWVKLIPNEREISEKELTPAKINGTLTVPVGRLHKMNIGPEYLTCFTVGDQLLWGAAEPLKRMLKILIDYIK